MKKLMFAAAIVCVAAFAHAAAVDWSANAVCDPVASEAAGKNKPAVGWLGYMIMEADYATVKADLDAGSTAKLVEKHVGAVKTTDSKGKFADATAEGNVASGSQSFYLVILNSGDPATATNYVISDKVTKEIDASLDTSISFSSMAAKTNSSAGWSTVPEPTSALLMVLGLAGLALKRKRV